MSMIYVIKDQDGNYVSERAFTLTDEGWLYLFYTGNMTTGFSWHTYKKTAEEDLTKLQSLNDKYGFDKKFHIEYIDEDSIKKGKSVIVEIKQGVVA